MNKPRTKFENPAYRLEGITLPGEWQVVERIPRKDYQTGSTFSVGYRAKHSTRGEAFLKALDLIDVLNEPDQLAAIRKAIQDFEFEAWVLDLCNSRGLTKVVHAISKGSVELDSKTPIGRVHYILFEHSQGDIRTAIKSLSAIDERTALSILHEVSIGLNQIHRSHVSHQDIKPSNILTFETPHPFRLTDFGAASMKDLPGPRDELNHAGSRHIAPPELLYGLLSPNWNERRLAADLYALGSLSVFLYTGQHLNSLLYANIRPQYTPEKWHRSYQEVMPIVQQAYGTVIQELKPTFSTPIGKGTLDLVKQLCDPDPDRRGWHKTLSSEHRHFNVDPFVSKFGLLRKRASYRTTHKLRTA